MSEVLQIFSYPFVTRAMIVGILVSFCAALLGVILVMKRYSLIGHGLGDVGFAALALAMALGLPPMAVSMPIVILASFVIMFIAQKRGTSGDAAIGMLATGALSVGVIITALSSGFNMDISDYMFGSILAMSGSDVWLSIILSVVMIVLYLLFYNRLFLVTFDESYARSIGVNVTFYQFLISFLTAVTVVLGMRMMGTVLISSLIIFPAMTAKKIVKSFKGVVVAAAVISVICFIIGIIISFLFNLPTGASVVLVNVFCYVVSTVVGAVTKRSLDA